jgi:ATP-dependent helicase YprA (DUF1998 family)
LQGLRHIEAVNENRDKHQGKLFTRLDPGSYPLLRSEIEEKKTRSARFLSKMHRGGAIIASFSRSDKSGKLGSFKALLYKSD